MSSRNSSLSEITETYGSNGGNLHVAQVHYRIYEISGGKPWWTKAQKCLEPLWKSVFYGTPRALGDLCAPRTSGVYY